MENIPATLEKLKKQGYKLTPQRQAILESLFGNTTHPSASEIHRDVCRRFPMLSLATVYNTLRLLEAAQEIRSIRAGTDRTLYDYRTDPHAHFICRSCGNVIDIEEEGVRELDGHRIQFQEVTYQGICSVCCRSLFEGD